MRTKIEPAEARRMARWYKGIAFDYRVAADQCAFGDLRRQDFLNSADVALRQALVYEDQDPGPAKPGDVMHSRGADGHRRQWSS